jgi:hypothetical protein
LSVTPALVAKLNLAMALSTDWITGIFLFAPSGTDRYAVKTYISVTEEPAAGQRSTAYAS